MCTAISYLTKNHYFGRNLDLDYHYQECVVVSPRNFPLAGKDCHFALIGMATCADGYPLFYDATNEKGLSAAALNFPGNAVYFQKQDGKRNIPSYDLISTILTRCRNCREALEYVSKAIITDTHFSETMPVTPLHWMIADRNGSYVIESTIDGLHVYENPIKVLTNNPPFPQMQQRMAEYMSLTNEEPVSRIMPGVPLSSYSRGMGAIGLPGDFSSVSRFVRTAFVLHNSNKKIDDTESITQFFHILGAASVPDGCVKVKERFQKTLYSSCCNTDAGIYYYTTADNQQITAIDMFALDLNAASNYMFPLITKQQIRWET